MVKNLLTLFVRNLQRQKMFSLINLLGLTVSITSTVLIYLYVDHEFSYDEFHQDADRIYRVNQTFIWAEGDPSQFSRTGPGVAHALKEELPEVELVTSLHTPGSFIVSYTTPGNEIISFEETEVLSADTNFFKLFNFPLLQGDGNSAFRNANTLMLTKSTASKYFGNENPMGKLLRLGVPNGEKTETYEVIGVLEDVPENSTLNFDVLLSSRSFPLERFHWSWVWTQLETFVRLRKGADIEMVREKLVPIPKKRAEETLRLVMNTTYDEYIASGKKWELFLQPITTLHLPESPVTSSFPDTGNIKIVYSLIGAAVFITLLSCINFMNLSTAQFSRRVKEASLRKVLGLTRAGLSSGYLLEAVVFCLIALILSMAFVQALLPLFNHITGKELRFDLFAKPALLLGLPALTLLMAVLSSLYPALFLSSFRPVEAMKGKIRPGRQNVSFRNGLVVFQFCVSIILIICTAVVFQQLKFVAEKDLGFDKENLIRLKHAEGAKDRESLVKALSNIPGVVSASRMSSTPPEIFGGDTFRAEGMNGENISLNYTTADENFIPTFGIQLKYGRNFSEANPSDINGVIINEAAAKKAGWTDEASILGKRIRFPYNDTLYFEVIGVVSDFNYWSLQTSIEPMGIFHVDNKDVFDGRKSFITLRIQPQTAKSWQDFQTTLAATWKVHAGDTPFDFGFIDEYFAEAFKSQERFGSILLFNAVPAILIACLGLLGMIIYSLEQRTKEIGIRKVSGASVADILALITGGYMKLVLIAFLAGTPIAYLMMNSWLQDFAYKVIPSPWVFVLTGISTLALAGFITLFHSLKAATTNPVEVLKDE